MKIAVNARLLQISRMEGIARYNYESLKRIVLAHPEDEFYFLFDRPYSKEFLFASNVIPIHLFPPTRHPFLIVLWFEWMVYRTLKKIDADVFLAGDTYMSLRSKVPSLLVCHDLAYLHYPLHIPPVNRSYYRYFFPRFHRKAAEIIAVSEYTKSDIIRQYDIDPAKITVAHNAPNGHFYPIDPETQESTRQELTGGKPYFIYLGSIHPRKNLENLIEGFNHFRREGFRDHYLVILGRPAWNTHSFYKSLNQSPYKDHIIHIQKKREELPRYIGSAEALCYVSLFEGFGIPILEGFEAGVPVITSNVSSMPEVAGDAAILADPSDHHSIGEAMTRIASDPDTRSECIRKGFEQLRRFSWDRTARILYDRLHTIARH